MTNSSLVTELRRRKLGGYVARDTVATYPADYIQQKIDFLDFLIDTGKLPTNPAAWLRAAIEGDFGEPTGYLSREERERQRQSAEERQRQAEEKKRLEQKAERSHKKREEAQKRREREHTARIQASLTDAERQDLTRRVEADTDSIFRKYFRENDAHSLEMRALLIHLYILKQHPLPPLEG
jgi:hypothetical protein